MGYDRAYQQEYKAKAKLIDNELGPRYRTDEARQGESFSDFKKRIIKEELEAINTQAREIYPAWVKMPNETADEFRKRLVSVRPNEKKYRPWEKMPNETEEQFKRRMFSQWVRS